MSPKPKNSPPVLKRFNMHLPSDLQAAFKAATAAEGKQMTDVVMEFIQKYVQEHQGRGGRK